MSNVVIKSYAARLLEEEVLIGSDDPVLSWEDVSSEPPGDEDEDVSGDGQVEDARDMREEYQNLLEEAENEIARRFEDANREAKAIRDGAYADAETVREQARLEGFEQGRADGYAGGFAQAGEELEELLKRGQAEADAVLNEAYETKHRQIDGMEQDIYKLALGISEKILGYELERDNEAFLSMVSAALDAMRHEGRVTLRVNAAEYIGAFRSMDTARIKTNGGVVAATVRIDPSVDPGGVLIETENSSADASPSVQLEQIAQNLGIM